MADLLGILAAKLVASDGATPAQFGFSIAVAGDTAIVGARDDSKQKTSAGAAYIFVRSGGLWTQQAKLVANDGTENDLFGFSVAIAGDRAIVGAAYSNEKGAASGSAYVFTRSGGTWTQQAKLVAADPGQQDRFGTSVALLGDTAVVGAPSAIEKGMYSGAAYVFTQSGGSWKQTARLVHSDMTSGNHFGNSIALSGNTLLVGAPFGPASGAAYVFTQSGGTWKQTAKLVASDGSPAARFGWSVALDGTTALVGAYVFRSAYVFTQSGGTWKQQAKLVVSDAAVESLSFGYAVALLEGKALIGAPCSNEAGAGAAYLFARSGEVWTQQTKLAPSDKVAKDRFGGAVAFAGKMAIVGESRDKSNAGAAYVYALPEKLYATPEAKLVASDASEQSFLGGSISIDGDTAIVGAYFDSKKAAQAGAAYVFVRSGGPWRQQVKLVAPDGTVGDFFGRSVAVSGNTLLVGASKDDEKGAASGSAYVFTRSGETWTQQAKLFASDPVVKGNFGHSVTLLGDMAIVGSYGAVGKSPASGAVYVFTRSGGTWTQQAKLFASDGADGDEFGISVARSGDTLLVGSDADDDKGSNCGAVYVFTQSGGTWTQTAKLVASDAAADAYFGWSVAVEGTTALVGAYGNAHAGKDSGAGYVFTQTGGTWRQQAKLVASDAAVSAELGFSVALSGDIALLGAPLYDNPVVGAASAYVFTRSGNMAARTGEVWTQQMKLAASDKITFDGFGCAVALAGRTVLVGAYGENKGAGIVHVYALSDRPGSAVP